MRNKLKRVLAFVLASALLLSSAPLASAREQGNTCEPGIRLVETSFNSTTGMLGMTVYASGYRDSGVHSGRILFSVDANVLEPYLANGEKMLPSTDKGVSGGYGGKGENPQGYFYKAVGGTLTDLTSKIRADESQSKYVMVEGEDKNGKKRYYLSYEFTLEGNANQSPRKEMEAGILFFKVKNNNQSNLVNGSFRLGEAADIGYDADKDEYTEKGPVSSTVAYTIGAIEYIRWLPESRREEWGYYYEIEPVKDSNIGVSYTYIRQISNPENATPETWNIGIEYTNWNVPAVEELFVYAADQTENVPEANSSTLKTNFNYTNNITANLADGTVKTDYTPEDLYWEFCDDKGVALKDDALPVGVSFEESTNAENKKVQTGQLLITQEASRNKAFNEDGDMKVYFHASRNTVYMKDSSSPLSKAVLCLTLHRSALAPSTVAVLDANEKNEDTINISSTDEGSFQNKKGADFAVSVLDQYGFPITSAAGTLGLSMVAVDSYDLEPFSLTPTSIPWNDSVTDGKVSTHLGFADGKGAADASGGIMKIQATFTPDGAGSNITGAYTATIERDVSTFEGVKLTRYTSSSFSTVEPRETIDLPQSTLGNRTIYLKAEPYDQYDKVIEKDENITFKYEWVMTESPSIATVDVPNSRSHPERAALTIFSGYNKENITLNVTVQQLDAKTNQVIATQTGSITYKVERSEAEFSGVKVKSKLYPPDTQTKEFYLKAVPIDQYNQEYTLAADDNKLSLVWAVDEAHTAEAAGKYEIHENGQLIVYDNTVTVYAQVTPTYNGSTKEKATGTLTNGGDRYLQRIELSAGATEYEVPQVLDGPLDIPLTATFYNQYDEEYPLSSDQQASTRLDKERDGIQLAVNAAQAGDIQQTAVMTVQPKAPADTITVTTAVGVVSGSTEVKLTKDPSVPARIEIVNQAVKSNGTTQLEAKCYDQYDAQMSAQIKWLGGESFSSTPLSATASFDANSGIVTTDASTQTVTVKCQVADNAEVFCEKILPVREPGEAAQVQVVTEDDTTVAIPVAKSDGTPDTTDKDKLQFRAIVTDSLGIDIGDDNIVWDILGEHTGVTIDSDGKVAVKSNAEAKTYTVVAVDKASGVYGTAEIVAVHDETPKLTFVGIKMTIGSATGNEVDVVVEDQRTWLVPLYYDQYGNTYEEKSGDNLQPSFDWASPLPLGDTPWEDATTQLQKYSRIIVTAKYVGTSTTVKVTVTSDTADTVTGTRRILAVGSEAGSATHLKIDGPDTVSLSGGATYPYTVAQEYTANVVDQFGQSLGVSTYKRIEWSASAPGMVDETTGGSLVSLSPSDPNDDHNRKAYLGFSSRVPEGTVRLSVTYYDLEGNATGIIGTKDIKIVYDESDKNTLGMAEITNGRVRHDSTTALTAKLYNLFDQEIEDISGAELTWGVKDAPDGVTLEGNMLKVEKSVTATSVEVQLTAKYNGKLLPTVTKELAISDEDSYLNKLEVRNKLGGNRLFIPPVDENGLSTERTSVFEAVGYDQFGEVMPGTPEGLEWSLRDQPNGMTCLQSGVVRITSATDPSVSTKLVAAVNRADKPQLTASALLSVEYEPDVLTSLAVQQKMVYMQGGAGSADLTVEFLNQYGNSMQPTGVPVWDRARAFDETDWHGGGTVTVDSSGHVEYWDTPLWFYVDVAVGTVKCESHRIVVSDKDPYIEKLTLTVVPASLEVPPLKDGEPVAAKPTFEVLPFAKDQYGKQFTDYTTGLLNWSVVDSPDPRITIAPKANVSEDPGAVLTVWSSTPVGNVTVKASVNANSATGQKAVVATAAAKVTRQESQAVGIRLKTPHTIAASAGPVQLEYEYYDQYGDAMSIPGATATWGNMTSVEGDKDADAATLTSDGILVMGDTTLSVSFTITPSVDGIEPVRDTITIGRDAPKASYIVIEKYNGDTPVNVPKPGSSATVEYIARVYNQYDAEMEGRLCNWSLGSVASGVTVSSDTVVIDGKTVSRGTVHVSSSAKSAEKIELRAVDRSSGVSEFTTFSVLANQEESVLTDVVLKEKFLPENETSLPLTPVYLDQNGDVMEDFTPQEEPSWDVVEVKPETRDAEAHFDTTGVRPNLLSYTKATKEVGVQVTVNNKPYGPLYLFKAGEKQLTTIKLTADTDQIQAGSTDIPFIATPYDQYGQEMSKTLLSNVVWSVAGAPEGVSITADNSNGYKGYLTASVYAAATKQVVVMAKDYKTGILGKTFVEITRDGGGLFAAKGLKIVNTQFPQATGRYRLDAIVYDGYGVEIPTEASDISWELTPGSSAEREVENGETFIRFNGATRVQVTATCDLYNVSGSDFLVTGGDPSALTKIVVKRATVADNVNSPVAIPARVDGEDQQVAVSYEAYGIDQYGLDIGKDKPVPMTNAKWLVSGSSAQGISINEYGVLIVTSAAEEGKVIITAVDEATGIFGTAELMLTKEESVFTSIGVRQKKLLPNQDIQLDAVYYDQYGKETFPRGHEAWTKITAEPDADGVNVSESGYVAFTNQNITSITVEVEAARINSGPVPIPVSGDKEVPASATVELAEGSTLPVRVDGNEEHPVEVSFKATVYDQFTQKYTGNDLKVRWEVKGSSDVTIKSTDADAQTVTLSVSGKAREIADVRVIAICQIDDKDTDITGYLTFPIVRESSVLSDIEIVESGFPAGTKTGVLTLRYLDQFGDEMERPASAKSEWSATNGVTVTTRSDGNADINFGNKTSTQVTAQVWPDGDTTKTPLTTQKEISLGTQRYLSRIEVYDPVGGGVLVPDVSRSDSPSLKMFTAKAYDQYGTPIEAHLIWSLSDKESAVSISQNGLLTVSSGAPEMTMTVYATDSDSGVYGSCTVDIMREPSEFTYLEVKQKALSNGQSMALEPVWLDQYKKEMAPQGSVAWEMPSKDGYGTMLVKDGDYNAKLDPLDPTTTWVVVKATCRTVSTGEVLLERAGEEYVDKVVLTRVGSGAVMVPVQGAAAGTAEYEAHVYNQYGGEMDGRTVTWEVESSSGGVSVSEADGKGVVSVSSTAFSEEVRVMARDQESGKSGIATLVVKRESPRFTAAKIKNDYIPRDTMPFTLTAVAIDQYGQEMAGYDSVEWSLPDYDESDPTNENYFMSSKPGALHFDKHLDSIKVHISMTVGDSTQADEKTLTISDDAPELREIKVTRTDGYGILYIPYGSQMPATAAYEATGVDQYLQPVTDLKVKWELRGAPAGVSFPAVENGATQNVMSVEANTAPGSVQVVAVEDSAGTGNKVSGRTIQVLDRSASVLETVEVREDSLPYGTEVAVLHANYYDQYGAAVEYQGSHKWYVSKTEPENQLDKVSITDTGLLTLNEDVQAVYVRVEAKDAGKVSTTKRIVISGDSHTATVTVRREHDDEGEGRVVNVPPYMGDSLGSITVAFSAQSYDQYGVETTGKFGWYLDNAPDGISISQTGLVTVTSAAPEQANVRVVAVDLLSGVEGEYYIDLVHGVPQASRANIKEDMVEADKTTQLTAQLLDQFGDPMSFTEKPEWDKNVTNGKITEDGEVTPNKGAKSITVTLTIGDMTTTKTLAVGGKPVLTRVEVHSNSGSSSIALSANSTEPQRETYTAVGYDQYGNHITAEYVWTLEGQPEGMRIPNEKAGTVTVQPGTAATRNVKVTATNQAYGISGSAYVDLTYADSVLTSIGIQETGVPSGEKRFTLTPVYYDQYGREMEYSGALTWEALSSHPENSVREENGVFILQQDEVTEVTVQVTTVKEGIASGPVVLPIGGEARHAATVEVTRKGDGGDVSIPGMGVSAFVTFQARVFDQYHKEMTGSIFWNVTGTPTGVSISAGGVVAINSQAGSGIIEIVAVDSLSGVAGSAYLTLRREESKLSSIKILTKAVPNDVPHSVTLRAEYRNQYNEVIDYKGVSIWNLVEKTNEGTTLDGDVLTIAEGSAKVSVTAEGITSPVVELSVDASLSSDDITDIELIGADTVNIPVTGAEPEKAVYKVKGINGAGEEVEDLPNGTTTYSADIPTGTKGIEFDPETGELTVTSETIDNTTLPVEVEITVTYTPEGGTPIIDKKVITVGPKQAVLSEIRVQPESDPAYVPMDATVTLTAKFYDQYGKEMTYPGTVEWAPVGELPEGVSMTSEGRVTVSVGASAFTVQAKTAETVSEPKTFGIGLTQRMAEIQVRYIDERVSDGFDVAVPPYENGQAKTEAVQFRAKAYDQYGFWMEDYTDFIWELEMPVTGVSVSQGGLVKVTSPAPETKVTVKASEKTGLMSGTAWFNTVYTGDQIFTSVRVDTQYAPVADGQFQLVCSLLDGHGKTIVTSTDSGFSTNYTAVWEVLGYNSQVKDPLIGISGVDMLHWPQEMQIGDSILVRVKVTPVGGSSSIYSDPATIRLGGEARASRIEIVATGNGDTIVTSSTGVVVTVPAKTEGASDVEIPVSVVLYDQYGRSDWTDSQGESTPWIKMYQYNENLIWKISDKNKQTVNTSFSGSDRSSGAIIVNAGAPRRTISRSRRPCRTSRMLGPSQALWICLSITRAAVPQRSISGRTTCARSFIPAWS